jgi:hypothetical protein
LKALAKDLKFAYKERPCSAIGLFGIKLRLSKSLILLRFHICFCSKYLTTNGNTANAHTTTSANAHTTTTNVHTNAHTTTTTTNANYTTANTTNANYATANTTNTTNTITNIANTHHQCPHHQLDAG